MNKLFNTGWIIQMRQVFLRQWAGVLPGLLVVTSLTSCQDTDYLDVDASQRPPLSAKVRFVNARPVNAGLHFWTFGTQVTTAAVPVNGASPYLETVFGNVQINFTEGNGNSYKASQQFGNSATFGPNGGPNGPIPDYYHTVFAARRKNSTTRDSLILFYDDLTPPPAGQAKVRFVNLSPNAPAVHLAQASGQRLFAGVAYGRAGASVLNGDELNAFALGPFLAVPAGKVTFSVLRSDTDAELPLAGNPLTDLNLEAGKIYTLFLNGLVDGTPSPGAGIIVHN